MLIFRRTDFARDGVAHFLKAGEIPEIGKPTTLLRLHRLDGAIFSLQKNARTVRLLLEGETTPIRAQPGKLLDEVVLAQAFEGCEPCDLSVIQQHLPGPAATGCATLTFEEDWHNRLFCEG